MLEQIEGEHDIELSAGERHAGDIAMNPGQLGTPACAVEICNNGLDDDCYGTIDEGCIM